MKTATRRNFLIGATFLSILFALLVYQSIRTKDCSDPAHTILVLVDYTDPIGADAIAAIKNRVWAIIDAAPNFSEVILRPILGSDVRGDELERRSRTFCRGERPDLSSPWKGSAVAAREKWKDFKDAVCGQLLDSDGATDVSCGSESRGTSFFESPQEASTSSPILEQVVDNARRFLTIANSGRSWDFVIATDWKEYTSTLDFHTKRCAATVKDALSRLPLFIGPNERDKVFTAPAAKNARSGRSSSITSLFVLREGMTDGEANCLERDFAEQFLIPNTANVAASNIFFERLPRTGYSK